VKGVGRRRTQLLDGLKIEDIGSLRWKLKIEKDGNDSLPSKHKEDIQVVSHKSMDLGIVLLRLAA
jgi:hypothetical protein